MRAQRRKGRYCDGDMTLVNTPPVGNRFIKPAPAPPICARFGPEFFPCLDASTSGFWEDRRARSARE